MSLHDLFTHGGRARARRFRLRLARRELGLPGPPGRWPGGARSAARGRRRLAAIDRALATETPRLASMFAMFNDLAAGEPVGAERLSSRAWSRSWPRPRPTHVAILATLAAIATLCVVLSTHVHSVRPCLVSAAASPGASPPASSPPALSVLSSAAPPSVPAAAGRASGVPGAAAFAPVHGLTCQAYATPSK